ncbi:hypothetical protein TWF730_007286 [Orbilia blumenaviensis]|uniref:Peptidase S8/S53 domain-containing protein n=1 Tax=Orbilia blumenaviensis TaxID=1796055 RepID=A0AAV9VA34_9PEZI
MDVPSTILYSSLLLYFFLHNPKVAADNTQGLNEWYPKIGTWEKSHKRYWYNVRENPTGLPQGMENWSKKELDAELPVSLMTEFWPYLLPPAKFAIHKIDSKYLGLIGLVVDTMPWVDENDILAITRKFKAQLFYPWHYKANNGEVSIKHLTESDQEELLARDIDKEHKPGLQFRAITSHNTVYKESTEFKKVHNLFKLGRRRTKLPKESPNSSSKQLHSRAFEGMQYEIERIENAGYDQISLSTPLGRTIERQVNDFGTSAFRWKQGGIGVDVYVIDSGCDTRHPEFQDAYFKDWIYAGKNSLEEEGDDHFIIPGAAEEGEEEEEDILVHHGSAVIAKIVGKTVGVATGAQIIAVKAGRQGDGFPQYTWLEAHLKVYDHIMDHLDSRRFYSYTDQERLQPCVIVSTVAIETMDKRFTEYILRKMIKGWAKMVCYFVVAAGNKLSTKKRRALVDTFPGVLGADKKLKNLVVVGGHDDDYQNVHQAADYVKISALSVGVLTVRSVGMGLEPPDGDWNLAYEEVDGTSFSAPQVAGILAILIQQGNIGQGHPDPLERLYKLRRKHVSKDGDPKPAYNGIRQLQWPGALEAPRRGALDHF